MNNFQRKDSISNAHVGNEFEDIAVNYFLSIGWAAKKKCTIEIGFNSKKPHSFDIGGVDDLNRLFVVECKSHKWTSADLIPSAKITVWNEAMLYFSLIPNEIRKVFFVIRDYSLKRQETLAEFYIRTQSHLIPSGVEILEYDDEANTVKQLV